MTMYLRKSATRPGAAQVQIFTKQGRQIVNVEHIGYAHTEADLATLWEIAQQRIHGHSREVGDVEFDLGLDDAPTAASRLVLQRSYSRFLYDTLAGVYKHLEFEAAVSDPVFRDLVIASVIEPSSKLDTIRILTELGLPTPSNKSIHRCLNKAADAN